MPWERGIRRLNCLNATLVDVSLLAALNQQLQIDESHRLRMEIPELERRITGWLLDEGYEAALFEQDGETAGYALFRREPDFVYLKQFFICRQFRRQGLGRQAVEWLLRHKWHNEPRVRLDVLVNNERGVAFWRAVGFQDYCLTMERQP